MMADQKSKPAAHHKTRTGNAARPQTLGEMEQIGDRHIRVDQPQGYHSYPPHLQAKYQRYLSWLTTHLDRNRPPTTVTRERIDPRHPPVEQPHYQFIQPATLTLPAETTLPTTPAAYSDTATTSKVAQPVDSRQVSRPVPPAVYPPVNERQLPASVAAWSLPDFRWPQLVNEIVEQPLSNYPGFAKSLITSADLYLKQQFKRIGIVGAGRNQGTSFMTMLVARGLQAIGKRVLLIDGDVTNPGLTSTLGLTSKVSWHGLMRMSGPTSEAIVQSERTGVCLMPLSCSLSHLKQPARLLDGLSTLVAPVREHFDAILIDLGPAMQLFEELTAAESLVDSVLLVQNVQKANHHKYNQIRNDLRLFGISKLIVAQNFVQRSANR